MDLRTLKTFHTIVVAGSFHRAAEEMNFAQSTVTMQMQKLEADLGVQLLERGKKIRLTEAGRLLYEQSVPIVRNMEQLQTSLADVQRGEAGHVRLGVTEPAASYRLPAIVESFLSRYPGIRISIEVANTLPLSERLLAGELDVALCSAPDLGSELYFDPVYRESFAVLLPEHHPLAGRRTVAPDDLRGHRLLITAAACPYRRKLETMLQEAGGLPLDTMEIGSMTALPHYVAKGLGIALVPKVALAPAPEGTVVRDVGGGSLDMTCGILCKASDYPLGAAGAKLVDHLRRELGAADGDVLSTGTGSAAELV